MLAIRHLAAHCDHITACPPRRYTVRTHGATPGQRGDIMNTATRCRVCIGLVDCDFFCTRPFDSSIGNGVPFPQFSGAVDNNAPRVTVMRRGVGRSSIVLIVQPPHGHSESKGDGGSARPQASVPRRVHGACNPFAVREGTEGLLGRLSIRSGWSSTPPHLQFCLSVSSVEKVFGIEAFAVYAFPERMKSPGLSL